MAGRRLTATLGTLLAASTAAAAPVPPSEDSTYEGRTSQGRAIALLTQGRFVFDLDTTFRLRCRTLAPFTTTWHDSEFGIEPDGSFASAGRLADALSRFRRPIRIRGARRAVTAVVESRLEGRFSSSRRASGTWRLTVALFPRGTAGRRRDPLDRCDSGRVRWSVRLQDGG